MLEASSLLLVAVSETSQIEGADESIVWKVLESGSGRLLGDVSMVHPPTGWRRFFQRAHWVIREAMDRSLLGFVRRSWWSETIWEVSDADEKRVGTICDVRYLVGRSGASLAAFHAVRSSGGGAWLADARGSCVAVYERESPSAGRFLAPSCAELGLLRHTEFGHELRFHPGLEGQPLVKMVMLAAALVRSQ